MKKCIMLIIIVFVSTQMYSYNNLGSNKVNNENLLELFEQFEHREFIPILITLDLKHIPEHKLEEHEIFRQRNTISLMQNSIIKQIQNSNFTLRKKGRSRPWMSLTVNKDALNHLTKEIGVKKISLIEPLYIQLNESIPIVKANDVWNNMGLTGEGQTIVILDTGVDYEHDFFDNRVVYGACFSTNDSNSNSTSLCPNEEEEQFGISAGKPCDVNSACDHGTHVAGIAAGSETNDLGFGVAPGANIISVQVFSFFEDPNVCYPNNSCIRSFNSDTRKALQWIYDIYDDYDIASVNMSLGGGNHSSPCDNDSRKEIIDSLASVGITTIAASGNNFYEDALGAPACISSVISVGATSKNDTHASYSNAAPFLDLVAPGSSITSSVPGNNYTSKDGTSMAAPHVAGTVALMKSINPELSPSQIRNHLHNSADKVPGMGGQNFTNEYGYGRLNAYEAIIKTLGFEISGPSTINQDDGCVTYQIADLPSEVNVDWTWSPLGSFVACSGSPQHGELNVRAGKQATNNGIITATISHSGWDEDMIISKSGIKVEGAIVIPIDPIPIPPGIQGPFVEDSQGGWSETHCLSPHQQAYMVAFTRPSQNIDTYHWELKYDNYQELLGNEQVSDIFTINDPGVTYHIELKAYISGEGWSSTNTKELEFCQNLLSGYTFNIYPNPATNILFFDITPGNQNNHSDNYPGNVLLKVRLYNWDSELILTDSFYLSESPHGIDVSTLRRGKYIIHILYEDYLLHSGQVVLK